MKGLTELLSCKPRALFMRLWLKLHFLQSSTRSTISLKNKSKWEINPTEDFDTEFEKTIVYQSWQENWIKIKKKEKERERGRKIMFGLCVMKIKKEMCPSCMKTLGIFWWLTLCKLHKYHLIHLLIHLLIHHLIHLFTK